MGAELDLAGAAWRKARRSGDNGGDCVEVARVQGVKDGRRQPMLAVRDSKDPDGFVLGFTRAEFEAFVGGVRDGDFDDLIG